MKKREKHVNLMFQCARVFLTNIPVPDYGDFSMMKGYLNRLIGNIPSEEIDLANELANAFMKIIKQFK